MVKVPRFPMALNNTTDELSYTDASSNLTRTQTPQQAGRHLMVNTQPSKSNPVDLTSYEESLLQLTNHSVGEGTTRYQRAVLLIYRSTPTAFYTAETVTADIVSPTGNQSLHTSFDLLCADDYNSMLLTSNASDDSASRSSLHKFKLSQQNTDFIKLGHNF